MKLFYFKRNSKHYYHIRKKKMMELNRDIARGRYVAYFQPKQRLSSDRIEHAEMLVRYRSHGKDRSAGRFIQELEELELIQILDIYMFEIACKSLQEWKRQRRQYVHLSCNISRVTLCQNDIVPQLDVIRERYGIEAKDIEIEITETAQAFHQASFETVIEQLCQKGYPLSLDDFGSGFSSLYFFATIPFTSVKLDRTLIYEMHKNLNMMMIVEYIIQCCHHMGLEVIAEGVETQGQKETLNALKCDFIQGYFIHEPIPKEDFEWLYVDSIKRMIEPKGDQNEQNREGSKIPKSSVYSS